MDKIIKNLLEPLGSSPRRFLVGTRDNQREYWTGKPAPEPVEIVAKQIDPMKAAGYTVTLTKIK